MQLIFIHGSGGCRESWRYQAKHFKGCDTINLPGHPEGDLCATIEEYAAWLQGYIHKKEYRNVVLVGHSLGGGIALQYALDYPGDLAGVVTIGSGGRLRVHPKIIAALEKVMADPLSWEDPPLSNDDLIEPSLAEVIRQRSIENGPVAFLNDMKACDRFDVLDRLCTISLPLLAIVGNKDIMTPPKYSYFMADNIANAKVVIISRGTHMVFAEKPDPVNQAIEAFLRTLQPRK